MCCMCSAQVLNVDLSHIENKVAELLKHNNNLVLIQGELIDRWDIGVD